MSAPSSPSANIEAPRTRKPRLKLVIEVAYAGEGGFEHVVDAAYPVLKESGAFDGIDI
jgi:hypothetical protein